jgi:DNA-binding MarR family transcriptional regulator
MPPEALNEREFELINIIGKRLGSNQRALSQKLNLSLGQTNMLIQRMVAKGYIRITQLNQKKMVYMLTPKGVSENLKKSVKYTLHTINAISLIKKRVAEIITHLHGEGQRHFFIYGEHDLVMLVEMVFLELKLDGVVFARLVEVPKGEIKGVVLIGKENVATDEIKAERQVNLIVEMSK